MFVPFMVFAQTDSTAINTGNSDTILNLLIQLKPYLIAIAIAIIDYIVEKSPNKKNSLISLIGDVLKSINTKKKL